MSLNLNGKQFKALRDSLKSAFPSANDLGAILQFSLNVRLANIVAPGPLDTVVLDVINWAVAQGRLEELIKSAIEEVPRNPDLRAFVIELSLEDILPAGEGFEAIVLQSSPYEDVVLWREQMTRIENSICRVEIDGQGIGTGFLVGANCILTNCHVADLIIDRDKAAVRFDYKADNGNSIASGKTYNLHQDFLVDKSDRDVLDFALIRLLDNPGNEPLNQNGGTRGWLTPESHNFQKDEIQIILQHPLAQSMKISAGVVSQIDNRNNKITYTANTEPGSSGSPVFTLGWSLVAIHHYGKQSGNIGIPLSPIWKQLEDRKLLGELSH